jgi:hypothetical protein
LRGPGVRTSRKRRRVLSCSLAVLALVGGSAKLPAQSPGTMAPFTMEPRRAALAASPADVSFLLDAPAGKHGWVQVKDGHLADGDGKRLRLWGVNITDWSPGSRQIPASEDAAYWAETLARFGVNCVRFQFLDLKAPRGLIDSRRPDTRTLDPEQLDREDRFIAELERRGIYVDFNLLVGRPFQIADGVRDANLLREGAKGTSIFDSRMIELQKEYARQLLTHRNPYTHRKYIDDPAVALVEINNENALDIGYRAPSPFYLEELTGMYNQWLLKHRNPDEIAQLRIIAGIGPDDSVPLLKTRNQAASAPSERFYAEAEFYNDAQRDYFNGMEKYLKQTLGLKSLVIATADHSHSGSGYPILLATDGMDVVDGHDYWEHPEAYVRKSPMVNDPLHSTVVELSRSTVEGKPYTVSEVNEPFPNDYDSEGIPILAAYGLLQDWDGILWYTFEPKTDPGWRPYVGDPFDISLDPVKMPELAAGALMFLRGDVAQARDTVTRSYTRQQVFDSMLLPEATERPYFTPGFPLALPLEHEVRIGSLQGRATQPLAASESVREIVSDTHQLAWYTSHQNGVVTIDSPRTQAFIGFVKSYNKQLSNFAARPANDFCTLQLVSLDNKPIRDASRMLLIAGSTVRNTGERWNVAGTDVTNWGGSPTLIEPVSGTITLRQIHAAKAMFLQALDGAGHPEGEAVPATADGNGEWSFALGRTATTWYEITVRR